MIHRSRLLAVLVGVAFSALGARVGDYPGEKAAAEKQFAAGSYQQAHDRYAAIDTHGLSAADKRWVAFRLADTEWRAAAGNDVSRTQPALEALTKIVDAPHRAEERDRTWAEAAESMGDFHWVRSENRSWYPAWQSYQAALGWWAGANIDLELARARYLAIVWRIARPQAVDSDYYYGYYGNSLPLEVLENALSLARSDAEKAQAHYLIAMALRSGDWESQVRVTDEFDAALAFGKKTDWAADALYQEAHYLETQGRPTQAVDGSWSRATDLVSALALYRRFLSQYKRGESRWWDEAKSRAQSLVAPELSVGVSNIFLPGSQPQYSLSWRNIDSIQFNLYRIELNRAVSPRDDSYARAWLEQLDLSKAAQVQSWKKDTHDAGAHQPGSSQEHLDFLADGAYVLEASGTAHGAQVRSRELVLITQAAVLLKSAANKTILYVCDAGTGAPRPKANTRLLEHLNLDGHERWRARSVVADENGLAEYPVDGRAVELFASAQSGDEQAFAIGNAASPVSEESRWKVYAYTDRPAYRPGETAHWKLIARIDGANAMATPSNQSLSWTIHDPRGTKVAEGKSTLNAFGSAWGELALTEQMPLGEYRMEFRGPGNQSIGDAALLRLEEYKLPEFTVSVKTPEDAPGQRKTFRVGDKISADIQVDYDSGGAVTDAAVQILVYQSAYFHAWQPPRDYPWFYDDIGRPPRWFGGESIIKSEQLKTDANGHAQIVFDTPRGTNQEFEYRIEARVTDSSRREVVGSGTVRATRQGFYAYLMPQHSIYRPKDKAAVSLKTLDANDSPHPASGSLTIERDRWSELWLDAQGKELTGETLAALRRAPGFDATGYRLKSRGYEHEELETRSVQTGANGEAEISFVPDRDGYYRFIWSAPEKGRAPVRAETTLWVASEASSQLGYHHGGLEILVDQETVSPGALVPVMISVPDSDRWVLFSSGSEEIRQVRLLHLTGNVALLQLQLGDADIPNLFLDARMVRDEQLFADTRELIVPPTRHYLKVSVEPDASEHQPRDEGRWNITTEDEQGTPVAAEVSLGVIDESIYSIQGELAADPRQFYFGGKRRNGTCDADSFSQKGYARVLPAAAVAESALGLPLEGAQAEMDGSFASASADKTMEMKRAAPARSMAPPPPPAPAPMGASMKTMATAPVAAESAPAAAAAGESAVVVRTDFRATALWKPDVVTGADGRAQVSLRYPETLTAWRATARAATQGSQFGIATSAVRTRLPLLVRLEGPRFYLVGDSPVISAVVNNNTDREISSKVQLEATGLRAEGKQSRSLDVPAHGEARADWKVRVESPGEARLKATVRGGGLSDAMEKSYPIYEHGIEKLIARSGKMRGDAVAVKLALPKERRDGSTRLTVQVAPSLAVTLLDALPYLIDYPYGCTEQTMSRFLPAAIVQNTLSELRLDADAAMSRAYGGIEAASAGKTHPQEKHGARQLSEAITQGLARLYDFQRGDGGWGWWREGNTSDRYMTAYVLWGLSLARDAGVAVRADALSHAAHYLQQELVNEEVHPDRAAWMLHALGSYYAPLQRAAPSDFEKKSFDRLWSNHRAMNAYTRALFALASWDLGYLEQAKTLALNLENGVVRDSKPDTSVVLEGAQASDASVMGTAHWGEEGPWWRWSESGIEATSFAIWALSVIDPKSGLLEPAVNWLVKNRRGAQWTNTKDSAIAVLALSRYLKTAGETGPIEYLLSVNGHEVAHKALSANDALAAPSVFAVDAALVKESNEIQIKRLSGNGPLYFSAQARFFSLEEPIAAVGHEIFVRRSYFKKVPRKTLLLGTVYDTVPLLAGGEVQSGDRVEVVIAVETKNDDEYLLFEDLKPAGFEAVATRSGQPLEARKIVQASYERNYGRIDAADQRRSPGAGASTDSIDYTGDTRSIYMELRDRKVALFADSLKQGIWEMRYELRAEVPGRFHALPVLGQAMYVPEIRANSSEVRVEVVDRP